MVCVTVPTIVLALPLIALVEAAVLRIFCCASFREAWRGAIWANLLSGLLGVPLAWLALVIAQIAGGATRAWGLDTPMDRLAAVTLQAPWLIPYEDDLYWMVPAASLVLLVPFYLVSVAAEYLVLRYRWGAGHGHLMVGVMAANAASYLLLAGYYGVRLWLALTR
jgi:hypothetical protein